MVKVYPKIPVTTMTFSFATSPTVSADSFWAAVRSYFNNFILYTDFGIYSYFQIFPTSPGNFIFVMQPFFAPNLTAPEVESLTKPWISEMAAVGVDVSPNITQYDNYHDAWNDGFPLEAVGGSAAKTASRLFPRANWEDPELLNKTFSVIRDVIAVNGSGLIAFNIAANPWDNKKLASKLPPQASPTQPENAVNPAWRKTVLHAISMISWQENATVTEANARGKTLSLDWMQAWRDVSPGAGAYASEGDVTEPDFRQAFYGDKYSRLLTIKNKYDPSGLFYAVTGVGSEDWEVQGALDGIPFQMGRLCKRTVT